MLGTISAETYDSWLTPEAAAALYASKGIDAAKLFLHQRMSDGLIRTVAKEWFGSAPTITAEQHTFYVMIPASFWAGWPCLAPTSENFWNFGDVQRRRPLGAYNREIEIRLYEVRLDPASLGIKAVAAPERETEPVEDATPIPAPELLRFVQLCVGIWGTQITEGRALSAARATYPEYTVSRTRLREAIRELGATGKPGNPSFRGD